MIGTKSPWGRIIRTNTWDKLPDGIVFCESHSHAGLFVPAPLMELMNPDLVRGDQGNATGPDRARGWFEQDVDAYLVLANWPLAIPRGMRRKFIKKIFDLHGLSPIDAAELSFFVTIDNGQRDMARWSGDDVRMLVRADEINNRESVIHKILDDAENPEDLIIELDDMAMEMERIEARMKELNHVL